MRRWWAFGFSVNLLTLFGLILAIGIVVDDAIVIVENAAHHIETDRVSPKEATIRAMDELLGPIIGITAVLAAVFLPTAFLGGVTGQLYRQFALTIAATAFISAINAVTLKPAQCASYLRPHDRRDSEALPRLGHALIGAGLVWWVGAHILEWVHSVAAQLGLAVGGAIVFGLLAPVLNPLLTGFYGVFNFVYGGVERAYATAVRGLLRIPTAVMAVFVVLVGVTFFGFVSLPTGFLPTRIKATSSSVCNCRTQHLSLGRKRWSHRSTASSTRRTAWKPGRRSAATTSLRVRRPPTPPPSM